MILDKSTVGVIGMILKKRLIDGDSIDVDEERFWTLVSEVLTPRKITQLRARAAGNTLKESARLSGVSACRISQTVAYAYRKLVSGPAGMRIIKTTVIGWWNLLR